MADFNENGSSWAVQTETNNHRDVHESTSIGSSPKAETDDVSLDSGDLRHRLRRSRGGCEMNGHPSIPVRTDDLSPLKSTRSRRHRDLRDVDMARPNYTRETNGLSPLRSPLNPDQRSSRVNPSSRRRSLKDDEKNKKENEVPMSFSPSKRNRSTIAKSALSEDVEEQRFRRRLDLPAEKESNSGADSGFFDPENEEDRIAMERREKQIQYGKSTESYKLYIKTVAKEDRCVDRKRHPRTPIKTSRCSRRNWDAQIKAWKKYTHQWANVNFPTMRTRSMEADSAESQTSSVADQQEAKEGEDDSIDLNDEENDESFLEGFELDYELGEMPVEANSAPMS